ncbi:MAG TPA: hypothetical protein VJT08_17825 [Terriglobales bacterium]|jgi:hypothetical protein|nr:hypothetical protein [Terriglobales bacterium]
MNTPTLIVSIPDGSSSIVARCSACEQTFPLTPAGRIDPLVGQREAKPAFEAHLKEKHTWRADSNQTAAFRLREMLKDVDPD